MVAPDVEAWLATVTERLEAAGYDVSEDVVSFEGRTFLRVAHRSGFQLSKLGNAETFFVFAEVDDPDLDSLRQLGADAFRHAKSSKRFPLPCGLFEFVTCFAVAIVDRLDAATADSVRTTVPSKHWASAEVPVVYDRSTKGVVSFEKTPIWGAAYYRGFRTLIARFLAP